VPFLRLPYQPLPTTDTEHLTPCDNKLVDTPEEETRVSSAQIDVLLEEEKSDASHRHDTTTVPAETQGNNSIEKTKRKSVSWIDVEQGRESVVTHVFVADSYDRKPRMRFRRHVASGGMDRLVFVSILIVVVLVTGIFVIGVILVLTGQLNWVLR